jgi:hypothetical protein
MLTPGLVAAALASLLAGCAVSGAPTGRFDNGLQSQVANVAVSARHRCTGRASKTLDGSKLRVRLEVKPCRVEFGHAPRLFLTNIGEGILGYTFGFKLERKTGEEWRWINGQQAFPLPLIYLRVGERSDAEQIEVYLGKPRPVRLEPGRYRVTKGVDLNPGKPRPPMMQVSARFRVEASD